MQQSIILVLIQIVNVIVSLISIYFIAKNVNPANYSIIGIYNVITSIMVTFSFIGIENIAIRNNLNWQAERQFKRIRIVVTNSLSSRIVMIVILTPFLLLYSKWISLNKYNGQYLLIMFLYIFSGGVITMNNSMRLILISFNRYVFSTLSNSFVNVFGKLFAIAVFIKYGFYSYLITVIVFPLVVFFPLLFVVYKWIDLSLFFSIRVLLANIRRAKYFAFSSYLKYFTYNFDQILVSIFFPADIFASFAIGKRIEDILKIIIENFFDPILQQMVSDKSNFLKLKHRYNMVNKLNYILLISGVSLFVILWFYSSSIIILIGIDRYKYMDIYFALAILSSVIFLSYKIKLNFINLFYRPKTIFIMDLILMSNSVAILSIFIIDLNFKLFYLNRIAYQIIAFLVITLIFNIVGGLKNEKNFNRIL